MNNLNLNLNLKSITKIIATLATIAILSMDLNVPYNENEKKIYTNEYFHFLAVFSVSYQTLENLNQAILATVIWAGIKYYKKN